MALDGVHLEAITTLVQTVDRPGRTRDRTELAEHIWRDVLIDPPASIPMQPIEPAHRGQASAESLALDRPRLEQVAAVDAGSLNPTTYQNGLVVDLAHAAMATTPTDLDRHRSRSLVAAVHGPPLEVRSSGAWTSFDDGYGRSRLIAAPSTYREEETAVHTLSLEGAEVDHAVAHHTAEDDLMIMDGSVYPASVLHWNDREGALRESLHEDDEPRRILTEAASMVERCITHETMVIGFVKNWTARGLISALNDSDAIDTTMLPWPTDYGLFQQLLATSGERDELRWTSWFTMDFGVGSSMPELLDRFDITTSLDNEAYRLGFMVIYDPRENVVFRVEAPLAVIGDERHRQAITDHILAGVAIEAGPPPTLRKADALASIGRGERQVLRQTIAEQLGTTQVQRFDQVRWSPSESGDH